MKHTQKRLNTLEALRERSLRRFCGLLRALSATDSEIEVARPAACRMSNEEIRQCERQHSEFVQHVKASA